jgi:uncharacterized coiled-coil protein SlyX
MNRSRTAISAFLVSLWLACFGVLPGTRAVVPPPDGGYPNFNTAEGQNALFSLDVTAGEWNTALGGFALWQNVEGDFNTSVGTAALLLNTGSQNTAVGAAALLSNTSGFANTAVGVDALLRNTGGGFFGGSFNTAVGAHSLESNTTGFDNTAIGGSALLHNTEGSGNTATGRGTLINNTTDNYNTAYGTLALSENTEGESNTPVGINALFSNTASFNTAIGESALEDNTGGRWNTAIGSFALANNTVGVFNTATGFTAGLNITGDGNVCIGAGVDGASGVNDTTWIKNVYASVANTRAVYVNVDNKIGTLSSSRRYKDEIRPMAKASEATLALRPVSFRYKKDIDPTRSRSFGLIAEEVAEVDPDLVTPDQDGRPETVRYEAVNACCSMSSSKEHRTVQELKSVVAKQEAAAAQQQKQIEALTTGLQKVSAQLAAASPSHGGLEASKPAPQVVNNP